MEHDGQGISRGRYLDKDVKPKRKKLGPEKWLDKHLASEPGGVPTVDDNKRIPPPKYIYIAGPLNVDSDDEKVNVQNAIILAQTIIEMGGVPYLPHLTLFWDKQFKHPHEYWMKLDIQWLLKCDAVYRMYGNSDSADEEVQAAITAEPRIPVLFTYPALLDFIRGGD